MFLRLKIMFVFYCISSLQQNCSSFCDMEYKTVFVAVFIVTCKFSSVLQSITKTFINAQSLCFKTLFSVFFHYHFFLSGTVNYFVPKDKPREQNKELKEELQPEPETVRGQEKYVKFYFCGCSCIKVKLINVKSSSWGGGSRCTK